MKKLKFYIKYIFSPDWRAVWSESGKFYAGARITYIIYHSSIRDKYKLSMYGGDSFWGETATNHKKFKIAVNKLAELQNES